MLIFNKRVEVQLEPNFSVSLPFEKRVKGRLRIALDDNQGDAGIDIERGDILTNGALLTSDDGTVLVILSQPETVSVAFTKDTRLFSRACYHVGNRHAQVQISDHELIYLHDHVLDDMLQGLGLSISLEKRPFDPENGAYASIKSGHHSHQHSHHEQHSHHNSASADDPSTKKSSIVS